MKDHTHIDNFEDDIKRPSGARVAILFVVFVVILFGIFFLLICELPRS